MVLVFQAGQEIIFPKMYPFSGFIVMSFNHAKSKVCSDVDKKRNDVQAIISTSSSVQ